MVVLLSALLTGSSRGLWLRQDGSPLAAVSVRQPLCVPSLKWMLLVDAGFAKPPSHCFLNINPINVTVAFAF